MADDRQHPVTRDGGDRKTPTSMFEIMIELEADGFTEDMTVEEGAAVRCGSCGATSPATDFDVGGRRRAEGVEAADESALVALVCPACEARGVLLAMTGPDARPEDVAVLAAIGGPADDR